jgi:shikimate dehydrogenase
MRRVLLLGRQIGYSASPAMLNAAFAAAGGDARYELADLTPDELAGVLAGLRDGSALGANVTQPHKLAATALMDLLSPEAERLGAINTIVARDGRLTGHNTDLPALRAELRELMPRRHAVVLGAGGASRAAQAALADLGGVSVELVDRGRWSKIPGLLAGADLLVHATPVGTGNDETPVPASLLRPELAVFDLVYRPSPTRLVREARAVGATARAGAGMLLRQAAAAYELWTGRAAPLEVMRAALRHELGEASDV